MVRSAALPDHPVRSSVDGLDSTERFDVAQLVSEIRGDLRVARRKIILTNAICYVVIAATVYFGVRTA